MATQFDVTQKLVGVHTQIKAEITDTKTGTTFNGTLDFDWSHRTVEEVLAFAAKDRRIAIAPSVRKNIMKYRSTKAIKIVVASPGHRDTPSRIMTPEDVVSMLSTKTDAEIEAMLTAARAKRATK